MQALVTEIDSWIVVLVLAGAMLVTWTLGRRVGRRLAERDHETPAGKSNDASLALLGLLLAFTFSMSLSKHDQRRQMVLTDSSAIGDFATSASLLKEPVRGKLLAVIREYATHRLTMESHRTDEVVIQKMLSENQEMQNRMTDLVRQAIDEGTPVVVPLVNTLNGVTSADAARLSALHDRLPWSIVVLLLLAAILATYLLGREQGVTGERQIAGTIGFCVLVSMVIWATLDLNQPQRGFIIVSQEPMQRLLLGLGK